MNEKEKRDFQSNENKSFFNLNFSVEWDVREFIISSVIFPR